MEVTSEIVLMKQYRLDKRFSTMEIGMGGFVGPWLPINDEVEDKVEDDVDDVGVLQ